jgi:type I restriction enzyme, S subunit
LRLAAYLDYQDSGVAYLGFIPTIWHTEKLKRIAKYCVSNVNKVPEENEIPIRLCNYTDVYYNESIEENQHFMETTATAEEIARFGLKEGDVVITKDSESWDDIAVPALVKEVNALVCGYHLAFIRSDQNYLAGRYLFRYLQSPQINQHFQVAATGVTRFGLPKDEIGSVEIALPSIQEQHAICGFLDQKTFQIDTLIRKK